MFKNDRMMMILTGLVLAVFAGSMVSYGDRIMAFMSGDTSVASQDDSYSVRAGSDQVLDVLSNDSVRGPILVLSSPRCGAVALTGQDKLTFTSDHSCSGAVEFAYCVENEGACSPNAVKVNVISLGIAEAETDEDGAKAVEEAVVADVTPANDDQPMPTTDAQAPEIAGFSVEMLPPSLAAPSFSELVSPSVAVASIRQPNGGLVNTESLNSTQNIDQNIATQNSASIGQTALAGPAEFAAPTLGESNNISLGDGGRALVANVNAPSSLQPLTSGESNIVQLERGPEALASLPASQDVPVAIETSPLSANPEVKNFAPVEVAAAQTDVQLPDAGFSATPIDSGPIALIALNPTTTGNAAGESLNIVLSEPGLQTFLAPAALPAALAPTSERPNAVSVLEREPSSVVSIIETTAPAIENQLGIFDLGYQDRAIAFSPPNSTPAPSQEVAYANAGLQVAAASPNQVSMPNTLERKDIMSPFIVVSRSVDAGAPASDTQILVAPNATADATPSINLTPASPANPADDEAVVLQASLPEPNTLDISMFTSPVQNSVCAITLAATEDSGAMINLDISSQCKANQVVTITHAGISFSVLTNAQGEVSVELPAMEREASVLVEFPDQSQASTELTIRGISNFMRAGVSWQADLNLNLNAVEFGAAIGSEGHIRPEAPRDYRTSRIKGGGYLLQLGDPSLGGAALAEVYSLPVSRNQRRGTIELSILVEDTSNVCGQSFVAKTVRTRDDGTAGLRNVRFNVPACGGDTAQIPLFGVINDIRLAGR